MFDVKFLNLCGGEQPMKDLLMEKTKVIDSVMLILVCVTGSDYYQGYSVDIRCLYYML